MSHTCGQLSLGRVLENIMSGRILIIEDSLDNMTIATLILESMGYTVFQAQTGYDGFKVALEQKPDVVIMDYHLPGINGLEATRMIKASQSISNIPVIALTADIYAKQPLLEAGCSAYLAKPIRKGSLLRTINQVLSAELV